MPYTIVILNKKSIRDLNISQIFEEDEIDILSGRIDLDFDFFIGKANQWKPNRFALFPKSKIGKTYLYKRLKSAQNLLKEIIEEKQNNRIPMLKNNDILAIININE